MLSFLFGENKEKLLNKQKKLMKDVKLCIKKKCNLNKKIREINDIIRNTESITERNKLRNKRDKLRLQQDNNNCVYKECKDKYVKKIQNDIKLYDKYMKEDFGKSELEKLKKLKKLMNKQLNNSVLNKIIYIHDKLISYCNNLKYKKTHNKMSSSTL